jgi:Tfp pilus assembly protein PilN
VAIKVNLLPREAAPARPGLAISAPKLAVGGGLVVQIAVGVLVLLILALGVMGYMAWNARDSYAREITELKAKNDALKAQLTELRVAEAAKREIQRRLEIIGRVAKSQGVPVAMLQGVLKAVPEGIWLVSFEMKPKEVKVKVAASPPPVSYTNETLTQLEAKRQEAGAARPAGRQETKEVLELQGFSVVVKGVAFTNFQLADFMDNLRKTGIFSDVDFVVTQADRVEQTRVMNFEVTATVKL